VEQITVMLLSEPDKHKRAFVVSSHIWMNCKGKT